jgi:hypothetical protein
MMTINRRRFLQFSASGLVGMTLGGTSLKVLAEDEHVNPEDVTAKALKYVHKSAVEGAHCYNCTQGHAVEGKDWIACNIFPGKLVASEGWCAAYMKKA